MIFLYGFLVPLGTRWNSAPLAGLTVVGERGFLVRETRKFAFRFFMDLMGGNYVPGNFYSCKNFKVGFGLGWDSGEFLRDGLRIFLWAIIGSGVGIRGIFFLEPCFFHG